MTVCHRLAGRKAERTGTLERHLEGHFTRMFAAIIQASDLESPGNRPEIRDDDLPIPDQPFKKECSGQRI